MKFPKNPLPWLTLLAGLGGIFVNRAWADHGSGAIFETAGYLRDNFTNPIAGITVTGDNYIGDLYPSITDSNGYYVVSFPADGNYRLTVDCAQLTARGYGCVGDVGVAQEADPIFINFTVVNFNASLQITNKSLPAGNVGMGYNVQLGATGGQSPYSWQLATNSASLPPGLSLNTSGLLSGMPTAFSAANIKLEVTDANSALINKTLPLIINPRPRLSAVSRVTDRFTMRLSGAPRQNYSLQVSTDLAATNWTLLFVTNNPDVGTFLVRDVNATNQQRFYRIAIGP